MTKILIIFILEYSISLAQNGWIKIPNPQPQVWRYNCVFFINDLTGWIAGLGANGGVILRTTDAGISWEKQTQVEEGVNSIVFVDSENGWAVGDKGLLLKTTNQGLDWEKIILPEDLSTYFLSVAFSNKVHGLIGGWLGMLLKTTNGGITWEKTKLETGNITSIFFRDSLNGFFCTQSVNYIFGGGAPAVIARTSDSGENWSIQNPIEILNAIGMADSSKGFAVGWGGSILKTKNSGSTWELFQYELKIQFFSLDFYDSENGLICGSGGKILMTKDGGESWILIDTGLDLYLYAISFLNKSSALAVGWDGTILKYDEGTVSSGETLNLLPLNFNLNQNYPNPLNPQTIISYSLPEESKVTIQVFNIVGELVEELYSGTAGAGYHQVNFNAGNIPSGVYLYKITASSITDGKNYNAARKMVVMK